MAFALGLCLTTPFPDRKVIIKFLEVIIMNEVTIKLLEDLNEKHSYAIAIFGGAASVQTIDDIVGALPYIIKMVEFYEWHESPADACRRFCHLCFTDPKLVEAYLGMTFEKLIKEEKL